MRISKNGLFLCRKGTPAQRGRADTRAKVYELPGPKRPPMSFQVKVFMAIVYLLFALYTGIVVKDLVEGKEPPILDSGGAPRPCAPPSRGIWPECRESGQK